jgi:alpha-ketoglutarate-dependent taurine dioxygenase
MSYNYNGVTSRLICRHETQIHTEEQTPLVIESGSNTSNLEFLLDFMSSYSSEILADVATHGAVLLRGFNPRCCRDFESAVLSLSGFQGIEGCLMSEPGRDLVKNTQFVLYTNRLYRTGGSLYLGGFHSENFYSPDVPRFIAFFCERASQIGGETGLVNTAKLFSDLPETIKRQLKARTYWATAWPLAKMASRYGVTAQQAERFCSDSSIPVVTRYHQKYASMYKPCVIEHPITKEHCLAFNFSMELIRLGFDHALQKAFLPDYAAKEWWLHRLSWRIPLVGLLDKADMLVRDPVTVWQAFREKPFDTRVGDIFDKRSIEHLAQSVRNRFSSFTWRAGDVLIVDNLKMAHSGMPGVGTRTLRVMIGNVIRMRYDSEGPGVHVANMAVLPTLAAQLIPILHQSELTI